MSINSTGYYRNWRKTPEPSDQEVIRTPESIAAKKVRDFEADQEVRDAENLTPQTEQEEIVDRWLNDDGDDDVIEYGKPISSEEKAQGDFDEQIRMVSKRKKNDYR